MTEPQTPLRSPKAGRRRFDRSWKEWLLGLIGAVVLGAALYHLLFGGDPKFASHDIVVAVLGLVGFIAVFVAAIGLEQTVKLLSATGGVVRAWRSGGAEPPAPPSGG